MTEEEVRAAVLAALLDYDTLKKARRLKSVKKAVRGTVMATMIGSTGIMASNTGRSVDADALAKVTSASAKSLSVNNQSPLKASQRQTVSGAVHFGMDQHKLMSGHIERLFSLTEQLPKDAELTVIGRADSVGGYAYNKKLGEQRALNVANYLVRQGFKVKSVGSKVDNDKLNGWLSRRVDIVISNAGSSPLSINLPPILDQYSVAKNEAPPAFASHHQDKLENTKTPVTEINKDHGNQRISASGKTFANDATMKKSLEANASAAVPTKQPAQSVTNHQKVRAVALFAYKHHVLTVAHKERLFDLIKQLPRDAELIVIGRTDSHDETESEKKLGKERAVSVANYLVSHGVKVTGIATKVSSVSTHGWMARRVDVIVKHHSPKKVAIYLPVREHRHDEKMHKPEVNHAKKVASRGYKKIAFISKKISPLLDRLDVR